MGKYSCKFHDVLFLPRECLDSIIIEKGSRTIVAPYDNDMLEKRRNEKFKNHRVEVGWKEYHADKCFNQLPFTWMSIVVILGK